MDSIKIRKDVVIPGTNIILEAGDVIRRKVNEFVTAEDRYDVDVIENEAFGNFVRTSELTVKESYQVPAIAQVVAPAVDSKITSVVRKDSIFNTCVAMGLPTKVNAMKNVVCSVKDMQEAAALLQTIYAQFGVKGSFMITWEGNGKVYFDPRTPVDTKMQIAYAKAHNLALPSTDPKKYIGY